MAKYATLAEAMVDNSDELAEAEMRYRLLSESFEAMPQLRANLNPALERAKAEILRLRAARAAVAPRSEGGGQVVAVDPARFRKSTG
ncbi:hypothetical protein [Mycobacterium sp. 1274761.0]|uniref:hypothetical protein n=1 Tax=Mycobacterium sp. 1274761.0 TaxID=1834077 RepID=UPI0007FBE575|nr:hypothetical protein [Mycobacterium sp. 1274761.0]OBK76305.1 hypothetical protein A5651_06785 [Mycobacterium sp. 1274761.0]